jgi:hypothetical protein
MTAHRPRLPAPDELVGFRDQRCRSAIRVSRRRRVTAPASAVGGIERPTKGTSWDRVSTGEAVVAVWNAWAAMGYLFGDVVRLLIVTGQRPDEGRT